MKINLFAQPFDAQNQPNQLGNLLIELLNSTNPFFEQVWIVSAFANQKAVNRLVPHIETAIENGAVIHIIVGIDHQSTSIEALEALLELGIDTKVAHNNQPGHTFHPKIYLFEATGIRAELFVGSNNLTEGGLFTNYEASTQITFYFPDDAEEYDNFRQDLNRFFSPPDEISQPLTASLIENLVARGEIVSEAQKREATRQSSIPRNTLVDKPIPASPFGNEPISRPSPLTTPISNQAPSGTTSTPIIRGELVWQKELKPSDVQRQQGKPTGGVRLTQADWEIDGQHIDQITYFRENLFGIFDWSIGLRRPRNRETTSVNFDIYIIDENYGIHALTISHKPSGEAGQGNYTTMLHWGVLANKIRELNLGGRTFSLYAPTEGGRVFTIEIK